MNPTGRRALAASQNVAPKATEPGASLPPGISDISLASGQQSTDTIKTGKDTYVPPGFGWHTPRSTPNLGGLARE